MSEDSAAEALAALSTQLDPIEAGQAAQLDQQLVDSLMAFHQGAQALARESGYTFGSTQPSACPATKIFSLNLRRESRNGPTGTVHCETSEGRTRIWFLFGGGATRLESTPIIDLPSANSAGIRDALMVHVDTYVNKMASFWRQSLNP